MPGLKKGRIKIGGQVYIWRGRGQGVAGYTPLAGFHSLNTSMYRDAYSDLFVSRLPDDKPDNKFTPRGSRNINCKHAIQVPRFIIRPYYMHCHLTNLYL